MTTSPPLPANACLVDCRSPPPILDMATIARVQDAITDQFLDKIDLPSLARLTPSQRAQALASGSPGADLLAAALRDLDEAASPHALMFLLGKSPYRPVIEPVLRAMEQSMAPQAIGQACLLGLSSILSRWEAGEPATDDDSIHLAGDLHARAGKMPSATAIAIARVAGHVHRRGRQSGLDGALDWMVTRLAVDPSAADRGRNVWHEAIALAISLSRPGHVHEDFAVLDRMPMQLIEKMCHLHGPQDPLTQDPHALARRLSAHYDVQDMVRLLQDRCGSLEGIQMALSVSAGKSLRSFTVTPAPAPAPVARL